MSMTSTDDLIHSLASEAGARRNASLQAAFAVTGAASLACALLLLVISVIGVRSDLAEMAVRMPFGFKLLYTGSLVVGTSVVALYAATPGTSATALLAMLPAVIFLASAVIFDPTGFPIMGRTNTAVVFCVVSILFLSLPAMLLLFVAMRKGAPTRPLFAGAVIGVLSASVGAMAYTLACKNDGTAFVAIWYTAACAIMAFVGAVVGRRVLRW
jgi:hypothetical protein